MRGTRLLAGLLAALVLLGGCSMAGAASGVSHADAVKDYDAALEPLKVRSDVLEERFAEIQQDEHADPQKVRQVLEEIIPAYAELLDKARLIEVDDEEVKAAHQELIASLEAQQKGLELALRSLKDGDSDLMSEAGSDLEEARQLLLKHRRLLSRARG